MAGVAFVELDELLAKSDYVSLHIPATAETKHLINAARLAKMKPNAYLINTARGGLIDHAALAECARCWSTRRCCARRARSRTA